MNRSIGPGPASYSLPTSIGSNNGDPRKVRNPVYTIRPRTAFKHETLGPGPADYEVSKLTRTGRPHQPMYSMRSRWQPSKQDSVPDPQAYHPSVNKERTPAYSFGLRLETLNKNQVPGPNEYQADMRVIRPRAPCYSMRPLTKGTTTSYGPGPAGYALPNRDLTHKRSPNYTIRNAFATVGDRTPCPGPAHYGLMGRLVGKSAPCYSFGIRHADWTSPMIVPGDSC
ncbi:outer dense fiber protein 3-B-like [Anopheles aquasalis]|uniref:outer dense fiber protein 3-B-like n=1 Tax=Anopheles aquasalis TaxID=42839 RepID=UPI00215B62CF|nr:outer dense fiber protein 3-B-like [Anopheles aquasalis]